MAAKKRVAVTGGYGFIGSALLRLLLAETDHEILNIDKLTYAANPASVPGAGANPRYHFLKADIADAAAMRKAFEEFRPDAIMHLAAESHVDRSIDGPQEFIAANIVGAKPVQRRWRLAHGAPRLLLWIIRRDQRRKQSGSDNNRDNGET